MATTSIRAGRADLHVLDVGAGPPVVMLHPDGVDSRVWDLAMTSLLRGGRRVVAYDRRGGGRSTWQAEPFSHVDDLVTVLDALQLDAVVLVGAGQGAGIALDTALSHPGRVTGLVLVCPVVPGAPADGQPPEPHEERLLSAIDELQSFGDLDGISRYQARLHLDGSMQPQMRVQDPARRLFLTMSRATLGAADAGPVHEREPVWPRLVDVGQRTLVLTGRHDLSSVRRQADALADWLPDSLRWEFPRSAHLPMLDDPTTFARIVDEYLDLIGWS